MLLWLATGWAAAQEEQASWSNLAATAEATVEREDASLFALNRIRLQLLDWREKFLSDREENAGRLATLDAQIAALGPDPSKDETLPPDAPELAARRMALEQQRAAVFAPAALAAESFARADGLIAETDSKISELERRALTERGATPLNPLYWGAAIASLVESVSNLGNELVGGVTADWQSGALERRGPGAIILIGLAIWVLMKSRYWVNQWQASVDLTQSRWRSVQGFLLSGLRLAFPIGGLALLVFGIQRLGVLGANGSTVLQGVGAAAVVAIIARWLAAEFFPLGDDGGPLNYSVDTCASLRRLSSYLGIGIGAIIVVETLLSTTNATSLSVGVLLFPINLLAALALFRFGGLLRRSELTSEAPETAGRTRRIIGLLCIIVAVASPLLVAAGYASASNALFRPFVLSLALIGFVLLLQQQVNRSWSLWRGQVEDDRGPLAPVLIGLAFFLLALPVLALIWGAGTTDMTELWARFQSGFTLGDTTLSPTDFLTFVLFFAAGYLLTRVIQSTLRNNILPRTSLDIGGRNAIVAGVGYVGIILAAVVAITSAGIDLSSLALVAGALSVGIGFGLQNIVSNFVSGIILLVERPVSEGDWIEVNGQMGYVRNISVRSTRIETFDRTDVIIPNADLVSGQVTNWTRGNSVGRLIIQVGVAYGTDTEAVMEILRDIAMNHPMVLHNPPPSILFQNFGASSLDFEIRAILRDINFMLSVKSEINQEIAKKFDEAGIEIPFPQQDVWLRNAIQIGDDKKGDNA